MSTTTPTTADPAADPTLHQVGDSWNMKAVGGDTVTLATRDLPEAQRESIRWLYSLSQTMGWTLSDLKTETRIDSTTLYRVFSGKYPTKLDGIVKRIDEFRSRFEDRSKQLRKGKVFVETSICRTIWDACEYASATNTMAIIYGQSHFGKTWALEQYQADHNHGQTKMVRMPASAGVQLMMKEFARACYVSPNSCFENLRESVLKSIDSHHLVIVDELHQVFLSYQRGSAVKALEVIREIQDRTGCGMILSGTQKLKQELMLGEHKDLLKQFIERSVLELSLPQSVPWEDLMLIAQAYGLKAPDQETAEIIRLITKDHGLKRYCLFLRNGAHMASKAGEQFAWSHFVRAHDIVARFAKTNVSTK